MTSLQPELMSVAEAAQFLRLKEGTVREWIRLHKISYVKVGSHVRLLRSDLEAFVDRNTVRCEVRHAN